MNGLKKLLRWWITLSSMIGFLVGWVFVAQATETEFANSTSETVSTNTQVIEGLNLPPIPSIGGVNQVNAQQITIAPSTQSGSSSSFTPPLRTGGS
ncbi:MAG: hypothetical protein HY863_11965 [Chloroflexi bacterium]|nr:hypothetical protein [Chloroflexota bacterium]